MNKLIALSLAGVMIFSTPVMAAGRATNSAITSAVASEVAKDAETVVKVSAPASTPVPAVVASAASTASAEVTLLPEAVASAEGKTVGEYMNNAVVTVPGLANATPIAQGGHVIINGAPSNQTFAVLKPALANVNSAKAFAATLGGKVLSVAQIKASVNFNTATVNFYMPGVKAGQNIAVYQLVKGQWVALTVAEVRADHVVVDMTSLGTLAFIEVPAAN